MYSRAMGCEVVVFSRSEAKRADAMVLGATEFCVLPPKSEVPNGLKGGVNVLLLCGGGLPDFEVYAFPLIHRTTD
jgi:D-arabinose 1-dehydrogenase-like Zn-dependent alcohol dehydrogenase